MNLDYIRKDIEHRRKEIGKQRREISELQRLGIPTGDAERRLAYMESQVDRLCQERDRLRGEELRTYPGTSKVIRGTQRR